MITRHEIATTTTTRFARELANYVTERTPLLRLFLAVDDSKALLREIYGPKRRRK